MYVLRIENLRKSLRNIFDLIEVDNLNFQEDDLFPVCLTLNSVTVNLKSSRTKWWLPEGRPETHRMRI